MIDVADVDYIDEYLEEVRFLTTGIDKIKVNQIIDILFDTRKNGGRVFVLGLGGSAGNASHLVNDLRKLCNIEAYAPTDNVSELTARANDDGFDHIFVKWLENSKLSNKDCVFVLSVGGGYISPKVSTALVNAIDYAHHEFIDAMVVGICGDFKGWLAVHGDYVVIIPAANCADGKRITPHTEEFQAVIWHAIISHPDMMRNKTVW